MRSILEKREEESIRIGFFGSASLSHSLVKYYLWLLHFNKNHKRTQHKERTKTKTRWASSLYLDGVWTFAEDFNQYFRFIDFYSMRNKIITWWKALSIERQDIKKKNKCYWPPAGRFVYLALLFTIFEARRIEKSAPNVWQNGSNAHVSRQ